MLLYIVRHGQAGQHGDPEYPNDDLRPLTKKGRKQVEKMAKKLAKRGFAPTLLATSPLVRCRQTAEAICSRISPEPEIVECEHLRPGGNVDSLISWSNQQGAEELCWVGHSPDVDEMTAALLGCRDGAMAFAKGAVAAIQFDGNIASGRGRVSWMVTPLLLGC
jgi:phosphohistidine phosphatase